MESKFGVWETKNAVLHTTTIWKSLYHWNFEIFYGTMIRPYNAFGITNKKTVLEMLVTEKKKKGGMWSPCEVLFV